VDSAFELICEDGSARAGVWHLPHGPVPTPAFMPVGTQASVKTLAPWEVAPLSSNIILANAYHLSVRPGADLVERMGGLHSWIGWQGNILTDSGGFQVLSLSELREVDDAGVSFRNHVDGSLLRMTPLSVLETQLALGSDVMMVLDECPPADASAKEVSTATKRSMVWAQRSQEMWSRVREGSRKQLLGIVQGGMDPNLRQECAFFLSQLQMDGYAIGGLSVGESKELLREMTWASTEAMPRSKIRYLMGVGKPEDLVEGVAAGVDVFDCVLPTRNARNGSFLRYRSAGQGNIRNARFREETGPLDSACGCRACTLFSASYLHHLFRAREIFAFRLLSEHNLWILRDLMGAIREAIQAREFELFRRAFHANGVPADRDERVVL